MVGTNQTVDRRFGLKKIVISADEFEIKKTTRGQYQKIDHSSEEAMKVTNNNKSVGREKLGNCWSIYGRNYFTKVLIVNTTQCAQFLQRILQNALSVLSDSFSCAR